MRKALALFTVIFLASICLFTAIFTEINSEKDNVVVTETVAYGDKSFAEGVTVNLDVRHGSKLQWKTDYTIGEAPLTETDFNFSLWGFKYKSEIRRDISLYTSFNFTTTSKDFNGIYGKMTKAYEDMMKDAEPYIEQNRTIVLGDYYDYYPLSISISFPNFYVSDHFHLSDFTETEKAIINFFNEFFKIPILEGEMLNINAIADDDGNIIQWGTSHTEESADNFDMYISGQVTDDKCFLSLSNITSNGNIIDTSNIPGGYGIYCLPYSEGENTVNFNFDSMRNVHPVDEENNIIEIRLSDDNKYLYIITKEGNKTILTVMDTETYEKKLSLEIDSLENGYSYIDKVSNNFILFNTFDNDNDDNYFYTLVSIDENVNYKNEFTVPVNYYGDIAKWDGECLYLVNVENHNESFISQPCRFSFTVYNKDGLKFHGKYDMSLATGYDGNYSSNYYVYLGYDNVDFELPTK